MNTNRRSVLHFIFLINTQGFKSFASPDEVFALHIFHKNSLNLIETVREKLKKYTSSTKAKLLNLLVINRKNEM